MSELTYLNRRERILRTQSACSNIHLLPTPACLNRFPVAWLPFCLLPTPSKIQIYPSLKVSISPSHAVARLTNRLLADKTGTTETR